MKADCQILKMPQQEAGWYDFSDVDTCYFSWKGRGTKSPEGGVILYYTLNRNHGKEREVLHTKVMSRLWNIINELPTFAQLDFRTAMDQWPLFSSFFPLLNMNVYSCYPMFITPLHFGYVGGSRLVSLVSQVQKWREILLQKLYLKDYMQEPSPYLDLI